MSLIIMLLLISFLIIIHELGHFLTARLFKIKVDKFGFGLPFGPTLYKTKWGDTEILVHAFLLGGYVSFPDDDKDSDLPEDSPERFANKSIFQRSVVISAGVVTNYLFAVFLVFMVCLIWGKLPAGEYDVLVKKIIAPKEAIVWQSGIKENDKIYKINNFEITNPYQVNVFFDASKKFDGFVYKKDVDKKIEEIKKLNPNITNEIKQGQKVLIPPPTNETEVIFNVFQALGVEKTDRISLKEEEKVLSAKLYNKKEFINKTNKNIKIEDFAKIITDTQNPVNIVVLRDNKEVKLKTIFINETGILGIEKLYKERSYVPKTFIESIKYSNKYLVKNTTMMIDSLAKLFSGRIPLNNMHGIIVITKVGSDTIKHNGMYKGLLLTAIISLNLAIMNLLPIPALDGGHLLFLVYEKLTGRAVNEKILEKVNSIGFSLLLLLMVLIIFNDIFALITKKV